MTDLKPIPDGEVPDDHQGAIEFTPVIKQAPTGKWFAKVLVDVVDTNKIYQTHHAAVLECPIAFETFETGRDHYRSYIRKTMDDTFEEIRAEGGNLQDFLEKITTDLRNIDAMVAMDTGAEAN